MVKRNPRKRSFLRVLLALACVSLGAVLILGIVFTLYVNSFLNQINRFEEQVPTLSQEEINSVLEETDAPEEIVSGVELNPEEVALPAIPAEKLEKKEEIINILLIGQDRRGSRGRQRSDAMILCTINKDQKTLTMTSFLRDMYVKFPDYNGRSYSNNRINATYVIGGMEMLDDCLELNFGVQVDHNIEVDFSGFEDIVDLVGGVDIELTQAEASWMGGVKAGMNRLNGAQALSYSRIRKLDSDFGRTNRQRKVLSAILERVKGLSISELTDLANNIFPLITTDMTNGEIIKYVLEFFPLLPELQITTQHIPAEGHYYGAMINGMSVLVPDFEANIEILKDTIG